MDKVNNYVNIFKNFYVYFNRKEIKNKIKEISFKKGLGYR